MWNRTSDPPTAPICLHLLLQSARDIVRLTRAVISGLSGMGGATRRQSEDPRPEKQVTHQARNIVLHDELYIMDKNSSHYQYGFV